MTVKPLSPARLAEIRERDTWYPENARLPQLPRDRRDLLAEVDRLTEALSEAVTVRADA